MKIKLYNQNKSDSGFALLLTLVVVGVIISIGLSVLDLSIKQIRLSTNAKDSEIAFNAANAGMECARYWRRAESDDMEAGLTIAPDCFDVSADSLSVTEITSGVTGEGDVYQYEYEFTWGGAKPRCTQVNTIVATSTAQGAGLSISNMTTLVPGYPDGNVKTCGAGNQCSVISVKGYNRPCSTVSGFGTIQREVLLQL